MRSNHWLSIHIYETEVCEVMLMKLIKPLIKDVLDLGLANHYFFIRYWENGAHIRLRFKGDFALLKNKTKPYISYKIMEYMNFKEFVYSNDIIDFQSHQLKKIPDYVFQKFEFKAYEPEIERYGGIERLSISEKYFELSSKTVLSLIANEKRWNYSYAMGVAIQLHVSFAYSFGMNLKEAYTFFLHIANSRIPTHLLEKKNANDCNLTINNALTFEMFENSYLKQRSTLVPLVKQIWIGLNNNLNFEEIWMQDWVKYSKKIAKQLQLSFKKNQYLQHNDPSSYLKTNEAIFFSYIHMTNNRLGILNKDEGYLGYILKSAFGEIILDLVSNPIDR